MQISIDRNGKAAIRLTKTEIKMIGRTANLVETIGKFYDEQKFFDTSKDLDNIVHIIAGTEEEQ